MVIFVVYLTFMVFVVFKRFNNKEMREDLDYWKRRCELAEVFIEEHPCDPDITDEQTEAYNKWCEFKKLPMHDVIESDSSDFELQRLFDWLQDTKRESAQTKFTAGMTRSVAREFEYLLKHSR